MLEYFWQVFTAYSWISRYEVMHWGYWNDLFLLERYESFIKHFWNKKTEQLYFIWKKFFGNCTFIVTYCTEKEIWITLHSWRNSQIQRRCSSLYSWQLYIRTKKNYNNLWELKVLSKYSHQFVEMLIFLHNTFLFSFPSRSLSFLVKYLWAMLGSIVFPTFFFWVRHFYEMNSFHDRQNISKNSYIA